MMAESKTDRAHSCRWLSWTILALLLGVALALRWRYVRDISLFVDEFVTAWAARNILVRGLPSFPSGNIYPHGFTFTYLVTPFVAFGPFDETLARVPGLLVSLACLPLAYWVGRRLLSDQAGLVAAAAMAVAPDCIVWGGRARMYGLLQLLTLLVVYFFYRGLAEDRPRHRYLAMGLLVVAIFTHAEAVLLLPALGLAALVVLPWRRLLRRSVILPFAIGAAGALAFFLVAKFGQPGHLETLEQEGRSYLSLSTDILSGPQAFAPVFLDLHHLPFTLLALVGLYFLFWPRFQRASPLTYLYVVLVGFVLLVTLPIGTFWQRERYLFLMLPLLFLIAGEIVVRLVRLLPVTAAPRPWQQVLLPAAVVLFVGLAGARDAYVQEWGYDLAFRYLRDRWDPEAGDLVVTSMSTASMLYLGQDDYFAIQRGYEEYIVNRPGDNLAADLWTATPALTSTVAFTELLATAPRVWFVTDGWRFQTRYDADFILTVLDQMDLEFSERGAMVFRGQGYAPLPEPAISMEREADFEGQSALDGFGLSSAHPHPGGALDVTLNWQALEGAQPAYIVFLHLVRPDGVGVAGLDEPMLGGLYQPDLWPKGLVVPDRHRLALPPDLAPGYYRLDLGLYPPEQSGQTLAVGEGDRLPLAMLAVGDVAVPPPSVPAHVDYGPLRLIGYDLPPFTSDPQQTMQVALHWQATGPVDRDYTVFVHLVDADGAILAQGDAPPGDPFFGTSTWLVGAVVFDPHVLDLPAGALPGDYALLVGLYHPPSNERLPATDARGQSLGDALRLEPATTDEGSP
jgi:hypothetical protein